MAVTYKGLTLKFGGDTTELQGALKKVQTTAKDTQGALKDINAALKLDPGNTDLLTEKTKLLKDAYGETKAKLDAYKGALAQLEDKQKAGAELTAREKAQYASLKAQIVICEGKLESYADDLKAVSREADASKSALGKLGQAIQDNSDKLGKAGKGMQTAGRAISGAVTGAATALVGLASSQEEQIEQTHQLDAAWKDAGGTSEQARDSYTLFYKLLGEEDTATEAAQNLARMTTNQQELDEWTNIAAGSFSKFGDALPLENLVEASQETAHTGTVTGGLADALNWATASNDQWSAALSGNEAAQAAFNEAIANGATKEDAFNAALGACSTEQERSTLITQTLNGLYGDIGQTYLETNATMLNTREQQARLNQEMVEAAQAAMPVKERVLELATGLLDKVVPALQAASQWYQSLSPQQKALAEAVALGTVAFGGLVTGIGGVLTKGVALGGVLKTLGGGWVGLVGKIAANPIALGVAAVAAAVAGLTWFFTQTEEGKQVWATFTAWVSDKWQGLQDFLSGIPDWWAGVWGTVTGKLDEVKTNIGNAWDALKTGATNTWGNIKAGASTAWGNIKAGASTGWNNIKSTVSNVWAGLKSGASTTWSNMKSAASSAWDAMRSAASSKFNGIKETIGTALNTAKTVGSAASNALKAAMNGDWQGAKQQATAAFEAIKSAVGQKMQAARQQAVSLADQIGAKLGFPGLGSTVSNVFNGIKTAITNPVQTAQGIISTITGTIKGIFSGLNLQLPRFALPHFWVSGGSFPWGIAGQGTPPNFGVDWYAKGGYFEQPRVIGVGEAGPEHVVPDVKLRESVEDAVSRAFSRMQAAASPSIGVSVTVNATVSSGADAYETGRQIGEGIASRLKQKGVPVGA